MATRTMAAVEEQPFACVGDVDWSDLLLFRRSITVNCHKYLGEVRTNERKLRTGRFS